MALSKEEIDTIKDGVNKARKKSMAFAFAKKRKDGSKEPLLLIDKTESLVKKTIRVDGQPPLMWGWIEMVDNKKTMAFVVDTGKPKELQQAMLKGLKKAHTILNKAKILSREDYDAELASADAEKLAAKADKADPKAKGKESKGADKQASGDLETEAVSIETSAKALMADPKKLTNKELRDVTLGARNFSDEKGGDPGRLKSIVEAGTAERSRRRKVMGRAKEANIRLEDARKERTTAQAAISSGKPGDKEFDAAVKGLERNLSELKNQRDRLKKGLGL
jgi:hypothetical protein